MRRGLAVALAALLLAAVPSASHATSPLGPDKWCADLGRQSQIVDVLGDSIMEGGVASRYERRWHQLLGASLRGDPGGGQVWVGGAIGGSETVDYLPGARYAEHIEFVAHRPSIVLMDWGTNEWIRQRPLEEYRAAYRAVINRVRVLAPTVTVAVVWPPWTYQTGLGGAVPQREYQRVAREVADAEGVLWLGMEWWIPGDDYAGWYNPQDRIHPNDAGQLAMYVGVRSWLLGLCGRG